MNEDDLTDAVMTTMAQVFRDLFARERGREHMEGFLAGTAVFTISRAEVVVVSPPPHGIVTDLGTAN